MWGNWIAEVLIPAEQYRGRYQLRLAEARALIGPACLEDVPPGGSQPAPTPSGAPSSADTTAPLARLGGPRQQHPLRRGALLVTVTCPGEAYAASATATLRLPGRPHALRLRAKPVALGQGQTLTLRLVLTGRRGSRYAGRCGPSRAEGEAGRQGRRRDRHRGDQRAHGAPGALTATGRRCRRAPVEAVAARAELRIGPST